MEGGEEPTPSAPKGKKALLTEEEHEKNHRADKRQGREPSMKRAGTY